MMSMACIVILAMLTTYIISMPGWGGRGGWRRGGGGRGTATRDVGSWQKGSHLRKPYQGEYSMTSSTKKNKICQALLVLCPLVKWAPGHMRKLEDLVPLCPGRIRKWEDLVPLCPGRIRKWEDLVPLCPGRIRKCEDLVPLCPGRIRKCEDLVPLCPGRIRKWEDLSWCPGCTKSTCSLFLVSARLDLWRQRSGIQRRFSLA